MQACRGALALLLSGVFTNSLWAAALALPNPSDTARLALTRPRGLSESDTPGHPGYPRC